MKNVLILSLLFFFAFSCNKSTTNKNDKDKSQPDHLISNTFKPNGHVNVIIFEVDLRRSRGKNKDNKPCNCQYCLGFCNFRWFPGFSKATATIGVWKDDESSNATIFFFKPLDAEDLSVSNTYYIDEDVDVLDGEGNPVFKINSGTYEYKSESGTVGWNGDSIEYHGYIDVTTD